MGGLRPSQNFTSMLMSLAVGYSICAILLSEWEEEYCEIYL